MSLFHYVFFFFFNDTATTEIYTLSLHDALPICRRDQGRLRGHGRWPAGFLPVLADGRAESPQATDRSEEHTSELQSQSNLVCRLLLEKKKLDSNDRPKRRQSRTSLCYYTRTCHI